jgi:assimilatory nitrate reductase catalytic subunit
LFIGPAHNPPRWDMVRPLFEAETVTPQARRLLLSGRSADGIAETGPVVCVCFGVGRATICDAVTNGGAKSVADIGRLLRAGTNCGSCVPELRGILESAAERV